MLGNEGESDMTLFEHIGLRIAGASINFVAVSATPHKESNPVIIASSSL